MKIKRYTFLTLLLPLLLASCAKEGPVVPAQSPEGIPEGMIAFAAETPDVVDFQTRASVVNTSSLNGSGFYASATKGSAGSETSVWTSTSFTKGTTYFTGNKYWNKSNIGYHFYASSRPLTFNASGTTVAATNDYDVVCAYLASPNYRLPNTLTFQHIFARIGNVTVTAASGYTISNVSMTVVPKTGGTYNLRTGAWSSVTTGSSTQLANSTPGTKSNDLYLVPGEYDIVMSWTATKGNYSQSFSKTYTGQSIVGGKVNAITAEFTGDARDVRFLVNVSNWNNSAVALGEYDGKVNYLTFEAIETGSILWKSSPSYWVKDIEYSINGGEWVTISSSTDGTAIPVTAGDVVWLRGDNAAYASSDNSIRCSFSGTSRYYVYGDVTSLLSEDNRETLSSNALRNLFADDTYLVSHPTKKIELPSTTLAGGCYHGMFSGCTSLTIAPELPALNIAYECYYSMFAGCSSLTTPPELPATTLAEGCYHNMFGSCTSLTRTPELHATELARRCYSSMFYNCTNLTVVPAELPATTLASNCYETMFQGCTSLTTAPELPATTLNNYCYRSMFYGCTKLTTAPELPATTLANYCYYQMFSYCSKLTTAPVLPATSLVYGCYNEMFSYCTKLNHVRAAFTTTPSSSYTSSWLLSVSSTGTFEKNAAATWSVSGSTGVPSSWTITTYVP